MAEKNEIIKRDDITFYVTNPKGELKLKPVKIYSPYNILKKNQAEQMVYIDPAFVVFNKWVYTLSLNEIWSELKYDQTKEFLSLYNMRGGKLTKWSKVDWSDIMNGKHFKWGSIMKVSTEKIKEPTEKQIEIQTRDVIVNSLPLSLAETMTHVQLDILAKKWGIEVPPDIMESWNVEEIKTRYIAILKEHLTD